MFLMKFIRDVMEPANIRIQNLLDADLLRDQNYQLFQLLRFNLVTKLKQFQTNW